MRNGNGGRTPLPRVLMSPGPGDAMPNPYNRLLVKSVHSKAIVRRFTWRNALIGPYDVMHVHWPEALLFSRGRVRAYLKAVLLRLLVIRLRLTKSVLVWTVHNEAPHDRLSRGHMRVFSCFTASAKARIHLNNFSAESYVSSSQTVRDVVIPHGLYPASGEGYDIPSQGNQLLFFGAIRPYKGVDRLVATFVDLSTSAQLRIIGQPSDPALANALQALAAPDERVSTSFRYFTDSELDKEILAAAGVILPYSAMTNSGVALLALSRGRPILAPAVPAILELQNEVGVEWVHTFDGVISGQDIEDFLEALQHPRTGSPDLSKRSWEVIGALHLKLYYELLGDAG